MSTGYSEASISCPMFPIMALNLIPTALITLAWTFYLRRSTILPLIRRVLFVCGLVTGTIASILLLVFLRVIFLSPSSVGHVNETAGEILLPALLVAFVDYPLAWAGRNVERGLATACGLSLIVLLYLAGSGEQHLRWGAIR